ncbi:MAG: hypothetical protein AAF702_46690 [Chloroflexota bacterium]
MEDQKVDQWNEEHQVEELVSLPGFASALKPGRRMRPREGRRAGEG